AAPPRRTCRPPCRNADAPEFMTTGSRAKKGSSRNPGEVVVDGSEVGRLAVAKPTDPLPLPRHVRCYVGRGLLGRLRRRFIPGARRRLAASAPLRSPFLPPPMWSLRQ